MGRIEVVTVGVSRRWLAAFAALVASGVVFALVFWNYSNDSTVFLSRGVLRAQIVIASIGGLYLARMAAVAARLPHWLRADHAGVDGYMIRGAVPGARHFEASWDEVTDLRLVETGPGQLVVVTARDGSELKVGLRAAAEYSDGDAARLIAELEEVRSAK